MVSVKATRITAPRSATGVDRVPAEICHLFDAESGAAQHDLPG